MQEKVLAKVGSSVITEADVNEFIAALGQRGASYNTPEGRRAVLNQLVNNKLLLLDAQRNLYEAEAAFRAELNKVKENLLINYAADKAIASANVTEDEVKLLGKPYTYDKDAFTVTVKSTAEATSLIVKHPEIFKDYEITKGGMDDVFLAVTGKKLGGDEK